MIFDNETAAENYLQSIGSLNDGDIDILNVAIAFSYLNTPTVDPVQFNDHIHALKVEFKDIYDNLCAKENSDSVFVQAQALKMIMVDICNFCGDDKDYDNLDNINLFNVMSRRKGLPISLCIIAISLCRSMGWHADGINFPGHFMMRLEKEGARVLIDPFQSCQILEAKDLRLILKNIVGEYAELSNNYYTPCTNRDTLLRFQNNLKYRHIDAENYDDALVIVHRMALIAPQDHRLNLDKAVLYARLDQVHAAIDNIKIYIDNTAEPYDRQEAQDFLNQLRLRLN